MDRDIAHRLELVQQRLRGAAERAGVTSDRITLIAVTKTWSSEVAADAVRAGATDLGENRVQEAAEKRAHVPSTRWHLIGPLQSNKARLALETFDVVHTVDRPRIADRLERLLAEHSPDRRLPVLLEVNVGQEPQKAGVLPADAEALARVVLGHSHLELRGLMCIPPFSRSAEDSRRHFAGLRTLRDDLQQRLGTPLPELSMGMSHDFEIAVEEGATMVRVGTAIFGPRS